MTTFPVLNRGRNSKKYALLGESYVMNVHKMSHRQIRQRKKTHPASSLFNFPTPLAA